VLAVTSEIEASKQQAAWAAVDGHILPHHTVSSSPRLTVSYGWPQIWNVGHRNRIRYVYFIKCGTERSSRREIGSTVPYVVERIVAQGAEVNRNRVFIPTGTSKHLSSVTQGLFLTLLVASGFQSKELIVAANLRLGDVDQYPVIDVTIDGADEYAVRLNSALTPKVDRLTSLGLTRI